MVMISIKWMDEQRGKRRAADSNTEKDIEDILWLKGGKNMMKRVNLESWNHRVAWVGRDIKGHLLPTSLPWPGTLSTGMGDRS